MEILRQREQENSSSQENSILENIRKAKLLVSLLVGAALGGVTGCESTQTSYERYKDDLPNYGKIFRKYPKTIQYLHDKRTNKCFVAQGVTTKNSLMLINCDEKVIKQAEKDAE